MGRRSSFRVGAALALVFTVIFTANAEDQCRSGCQGTAQTFKYAEGTTYKYKFDSKIDITLSSAEGQKTSTEVKGTVLVTQQPQCNQVIRLQGVQIIGADGKKHTGQIPDIEKAIRINFNDGRIEDSICVTPGDTQNSLNIKRAIASLFQVNLKNGYEVDVFGSCPTDINHHTEGQTLVVTKTRNLNKCAHRENINQDFIATAFNLNSEIKSSPILNSDYNAKIKIKNGILEQATVTENYLYVPFSAGNNGAKAQVETKLQFAGTSKDNVNVKVAQPRSIIFEDPHPVNSPKSNLNSILQAVKDVAKTVKLTVSDKTAKEFVNLVRILRVSSKDDLLAVYNQVKAGVGFEDKTAAKKLFLDALLRAGNGDNAEVALELIRSKELNDIEQRIVYLGLPLIRHATESLLNTAASLLDQPNLPREAFLGFGALAGKFCRQHNCQKVDGLNKLTQKLVEKLEKPSDRQKENDVIYALKALGNIHQLNDGILSKITAIANDKKVSNRIRVAALSTYLADPCKFRDSALSILKDIQQDSEIRIKAYLVLAQCPNAKVGNAIKALLENEPSYQVGGFIVSHIKNLRSSANPDKELAKQHLGFINLPKRFPVDYRKWSFNNEFSYSVDTLGLASSVESDVIYSQQSYLPRSTSLNLTAEVFGHTFNFLEIDTRQENLDRLVEHYFGPKGVIRGQSLQELWDTKGKKGKEYFDELKDTISKHLRARRDIVKADIDHTKQVQVKTNELNKDLDLDLSVKAFGSELLFLNINDDIYKYTPEAFLEKLTKKLDEGIDKLKNFDETVRFNLLFLDAEFAYPTSTGFPLRLGVEGAANGQIKAAGSVDVKALLNKDTSIKLSLVPSANILVSGRLTLDTWLVENGLKLTSNLYTATGIDAVVELFNNRRGIDVKLSAPLQKQDLISATHDIVFHTRQLGAPEQNAPLKFAQNKDFEICVDQLNPLIGLTFCAEYNGPNLAGKVPRLPFPLAGDAKVGVTIEREDISQFHVRHVLYDSPDKIGTELRIETIDKSNQPKVSLQVDAFLTPEKFVRATLISPIKKAELEGRITTDNKEKSLQLKLKHDNNEYFGKVGVAVSGTDSRSVYKPILEYKTPSQGATVPPYHVEGQVVVEKSGKGTKYVLDNVKFVLDNHKTISLNGNLGQDGESFFTDLTASDGSNSGKLNGKLQVNPNLVKVDGQLTNSLNPQANIKLVGEVKRATNELEANLELTHGSDLSSTTNKLSLGTHVIYNVQEQVYKTKNRITYPLFGVDGKFQFEKVPKKFDYELSAQYQDFKVGSELELEYNKKEVGDYDLEAKAFGLGQKLEIEAKREIQGDESKIAKSIKLNDKKLEVTGKIKHHVQPQDLDIGADLTVKTNNKEFNINNALVARPNELTLNHKITSGGKTYSDVTLKANKVNVNGHLKVNTSPLNINGQIKSNKGQGNADLLVDFPILKKQVKVDSTFTIQDPVYNLNVNFYPLFNEDKNKKISISTQTKYSPTSVESKNSLNFFEHKLAVNAKCNHEGDFNNGKANWEIDATFPQNQQLKLKGNHAKTTKNGVVNGDFTISGSSNQLGTATFKGTIKDTSARERVWDVYYVLSLENPSKENINIDLGSKRVKQDGVSVQWTNKIWGSSINPPIESSIKGNHNSGVGKYEISSQKGPNAALNIKGSYDVSRGGKPVSGDVSINLVTPSKVLKTLKASASGSVLKTDVLELKGAGSVYAENDNAKIVDVSGNGEIKATKNDGKITGSVKYGQDKQVSVDVGYNQQGDEKTKNLNGNAAITYGPNQLKGEISLKRPAEHEYLLDVKLDLPTQSYKQNHLQVHSKRADRKLTSKVTFTSDGKTWTSETLLDYNEHSPVINIQTKCPEGKLSQLYAKINTANERQLNSELKIVSERRNFLFEAAVDSNVESVDDFHIKVSLNSPNLKLDKIVAEAQNKAAAKTGRRIQVTIKSGDKNLLQGSTSYQSREEGGKLIVEGSGNFKVKEESKSANFKYIRQNLVQDKNGETGLEISFDAGLGNKAIDAELKITNKQFRISNSYCEEKKECAHIEIDSKTNIQNLEFNQELEITVDLRKLGLSHEFGLKAVTARKGYFLDHTVDVHFQSQENAKYQYSLYVHPKEFGVSLTTPKRVVALEGNVKLPEDIKQGGKASGEVSFYLDKKNQPKQKTSLNGYLNVDPKSRELDGQVQFTNPGLKRPLTAAIQTQVQPESAQQTVTLDVFAQPNQKLTIVTKAQRVVNQDRYEVDWSSEITSAGLNVNIKTTQKLAVDKAVPSAKYQAQQVYQVAGSKYESAANVEASPKQLNVLLKLINIELLNAQNKFDINRDNQVVESNLKVYGAKPLASKLEVKNWNTVKYQLKPANLQISSGLIPGQIADFRADIGGKPLAHVTVKLDEANFLKSDYGVDSNNIKTLVLEPAKKEIESELKEGQNLVQSLSKTAQNELKNLGELVRKSQPNLKPVRDYYTSELGKIKEEILSDKNIKELSELLHNLINAFTEAFGGILRSISDTIEAFFRAVHEASSKVLAALENDLVPKLKEIAQVLIQHATSIINKASDVVFAYIAQVLQILEKYQPELKQIGAALGEISQDVGRFVVKAYEQARAILEEQFQRIYNEVKALPIFEELKQQISNFKPDSEVIKNGIRDILNTIKDITPSDELKKLIEQIQQYVEKKLNNQAVDDFKVIEGILKQFIAIVQRIFQGLVSQAKAPELPQYQIPVPLLVLSKLPRLAAVKFSPLSYLLHEDVPDVSSFLLSLINHPRNLVPPFPLYGIVAQGQHIFTFDGRHLTFPGKCNYLLAKDAVDGNFTIVGAYTNGLLTAITLSDKSGDSVTLKKGGQVLLNFQPTELPARKPTIAAFRGYEPITLVTAYGAEVICGQDLIVCGVLTSGFYHGKIRGLLGNGNNEPYDDFTIPNGKIVTTESDFGNAYKTQASCGAVKTVDHHAHHEVESCQKLFGWDSDLRICYPFVPTDNFKLACQHGVAAGVQDTERAIAVAYVAACNRHNIPVVVPSQFVKCQNAETPAEVGDKFSVKAGKVADVVILVDTVKSNEPVYKELVQPLVQQVTNELHAKGINDVDYHIITWGGENQWPSHVTVAGKLTFKNGKAPNLKFTEAPAKTLVTGTKLDQFFQTIQAVTKDVKLALGIDLQARTYQEALRYPFRANAVKSVIAVTSEPCETGRFFALQLLRTLLYRDKTIKVNLVTPFEEPILKDAKHAKEVVGFNSETVFTTKKGAKNDQLVKDLKYNDYCVDFTIRNGGNVYVANNFVAAKGAARKQFVQSATHSLVDQYLSVKDQGLDCGCRYVSPYGAKNVCTVVKA